MKAFSSSWYQPNQLAISQHPMHRVLFHQKSESVVIPGQVQKQGFSPITSLPANDAAFPSPATLKKFLLHLLFN
jgi:hypothetical protein